MITDPSYYDLTVLTEADRLWLWRNRQRMPDTGRMGVRRRFGGRVPNQVEAAEMLDITLQLYRSLESGQPRTLNPRAANRLSTITSKNYPLLHVPEPAISVRGMRVVRFLSGEDVPEFAGYTRPNESDDTFNPYNLPNVDNTTIAELIGAGIIRETTGEHCQILSLDVPNRCVACGTLNPATDAPCNALMLGELCRLARRRSKESLTSLIDELGTTKPTWLAMEEVGNRDLIQFWEDRGFTFPKQINKQVEMEHAC